VTDIGDNKEGARLPLEKSGIDPESDTEKNRIDAERNRIELNKARLDLAWKHFEHYAKQRVTKFNLHVILVGAILYAYSTMGKTLGAGTEPINVQSLIAGFGIIISAVFLGLDRRNQFLYRIAEYNLFLLERQFLYDKSNSDHVDKVERKVSESTEHSDRSITSRHYLGIVSEEYCSEGKSESVLGRRGPIRNWIHNRIRYREIMVYYYLVIMTLFLILMALPYSRHLAAWASQFEDMLCFTK